MSDTAAEQLLAFVQTEFADPFGVTGVTVDSDLLTSGLIDSFGVMRLVAHVQECFDITVPPGELTIENFGTINALATYVALTKSKAAAI